MNALARHWPEYVIEALCLGTFMVSAAAFATLLYHPASPLAMWQTTEVIRRVPMGVAMGLTAIALIYSPLGRRSGAHMNPAVTLAFLRLGKITPMDAAAYVAAQFTGGLTGILVAGWLLQGLLADPAVNFVATTPGRWGLAAAFSAEAAMSFVMMATVLVASSSAALTRYTGLIAGLLVATYIVVEAPISGMSMNPARTLGSNLMASAVSTLWIYFIAPPLGMLLAAEWFVLRHGRQRVRCATLHHRHDRCIFRCSHMETA